MQDELQATAEALAAELGRSVYIEAPGYIPLAVSTHYGALDKARMDALLARTIAPEMVAYYKQWHLDAADEPVHIPGNNALGLLPRVVYPIRHNGRLLARVWLVNAEPALVEDDDATVARAARVIGRILFRRDEKTQQRADADEAALRTLLRGDVPNRQAVLDEALWRHDIASGSSVTVLVAQGVAVVSSRVEVTSEALKSFAADVGTASGGMAVIPAAWSSELVAVSPVRGDVQRTGRALAPVLRAVATRHGLQIAGIGIGAAVHGADGLTDSYRQAKYCASVDRKLAPLEGYRDWDHLGMLRLFAEVPWNTDGIDLIHPGLGRLFEDTRSPLPGTLWTYLQCGGDAQQTISQLNVHRGNLYYRLGRAEEILGLSLNDGNIRLSLHAGLLLAKLAGFPGLDTAPIPPFNKTP
ncbi:PucR family transcriptional regulator [Paenarthrobacter sp. NPDC090520]|uniref:PucR family transcriptional regulator n=1 Tax=Paenarthrobacter sp. NPDC090520 TaxID=3364382 RepID=UPI0037F8A2D5